MRGGKSAVASAAVAVEGRLPRGWSRKFVSAAASYFAARSSARCGEAFREVSVVLQNDEASAAAHLAIMGDGSATDVITQRYDPMPPEPDGVYGELYVNVERAAAYVRRRGGDPLRETLLYIAHGMDHLSGADDSDPAGRKAMRRRELGWIRDFAGKES